MPLSFHPFSLCFHIIFTDNRLQMVVQLPPQPAGGTPLPLQPQNPPTLNDIFNAVDYNGRIHASHGYILIDFLIVLCSLCSSRKCGNTT